MIDKFYFTSSVIGKTTKFKTFDQDGNEITSPVPRATLKRAYDDGMFGFTSQRNSKGKTYWKKTNRATITNPNWMSEYRNRQRSVLSPSMLQAQTGPIKVESRSGLSLVAQIKLQQQREQEFHSDTNQQQALKNIIESKHLSEEEIKSGYRIMNTTRTLNGYYVVIISTGDLKFSRTFTVANIIAESRDITLKTIL